MKQLTEHQIQCQLVQWARTLQNLGGNYADLELLHAIPNGAKLPWRKNDNGQRYSPEANKLKAEGLLPGIPDLSLPVASLGYHGLYIEMKRPGGKVSEEQKVILDKLCNNGYLAAVAWGFDEAKEIICKYLGITDVY